MYMLDTNICIYVIKKRPPKLLEKFNTIEKNSLCVSVVTYAELWYGVERSAKKKRNRRVLEEFMALLDVLPWAPDAAREYGNIPSDLESKGTPIGNMDLLIAAHALATDCVLVSNNLREFRRIKKLKCENWV